MGEGFFSCKEESSAIRDGWGKVDSWNVGVVQEEGVLEEAELGDEEEEGVMV